MMEEVAMLPAVLHELIREVVSYATPPIVMWFGGKVIKHARDLNFYFRRARWAEWRLARLEETAGLPPMTQEQKDAIQ